MADSWDQKIRQLFLQAGVSYDKKHNQTAILALTVDSDDTALHQSVCAFQLPLREYLQRLQAVGAEINQTDCPESSFDFSQAQCIISIRGSPSLSLLRCLGIKFHLDPDVLLGHLPFTQAYRILSLPSQPRASVSIRMISLGSYTNPIPLPADLERQLIKDKETEVHNKRLFDQNRYSVDQYRKVNLHGHSFVSVEQQVTFVPILTGTSSWSAILFNDSGPERFNGPYSDRRSIVQFVPLRDPGLLSLDPLPLPLKHCHHPDPCQSRAQSNLKIPEDHYSLCMEDPMVFVADLLKTSASSWAVFFSFLHHSHRILTPPYDAEARVTTLRLDKTVADRADTYFEDVLDFIQKSHSPEWPVCAGDINKTKVEKILEIVGKDFKRLRVEAATISTSCREAIDIEMNTTNVQLSKAGLAQAKTIQILTFLAYFFIPSAFIASVFGMNVSAFTNPNPPLWKFFATVVPFTAFFLMIPAWRSVISAILMVATNVKNFWGA